MTGDELALNIDAYVDGAIIGELGREGEPKVDVVLRAAKREHLLIEGKHGLEDTPVVAPTGDVVPLSSLAIVDERLGPTIIQRIERKRAITLQISPPDDVALEEAIELVNTKVVDPMIADGLIPNEVDVRLAGTAGKLDEAQGRFALILLMAFVISYLLLAALFEDFVAPVAVLVTVPLAAGGGILALRAVDAYLGAQPLDLMTALGFLILIGVVVNNAILVVDGAIAAMGRGMSLDEAVPEAVRGRVRPIFMSTMTSLAGLAPMVLFSGSGSELYRGVGAVVLGGLAVSSVLTLFVVPSLFSLLWRARTAVVRLVAGSPAHTAATLVASLAAVGVGVGMPSASHAQDSGVSITLEESLERAKQGNEAWFITKARLEQSRASLENARAALFPDVQLDASLTRFPEPITLGDGRVIRPQYVWGLDGRVSQTLVDLTVLPEIERREALLEQQDVDRQWAERLVLLEVEQAWFTLAAAERDVEILEEILSLRSEDAERIHALVRGERAVPLDKARADTLVLQTEQAITDALAARDDAADALAALLGDDGGPSRLRAASANSALATDRGLPDAPKTILERPDFVAEQLALEANQRSTRGAQGLWYPTVGIGANASLGPSTLNNPQGFLWSVTLNATWFVFDGGARRAQIQQLEQRTRELELLRDRRARQANVELRRVRRDWGAARSAERVIAQRTRIAQRQLDLAKRRFAAGLASSLELNDASEALLSARREENANRLRQRLAEARYVALVGF
ncbi:MAG: efflux RND transporter permease subunit, partial [Myxococcota bacterium]